MIPEDVNAALHPSILQVVDMAKERLAPRRVWLFGSRARGTHHDRSDIDLAFELDPARATSWAAFKLDAIEQARTLLHLDLLELGQCDPELARTIRTEGILLYER